MINLAKELMAMVLVISLKNLCAMHGMIQHNNFSLEKLFVWSQNDRSCGSPDRAALSLSLAAFGEMRDVPAVP